MRAKSNLIRIKGIAPLAAVLAFGAVYFNLSYEQHLKKWLEQKATLAYGAAVDIDKLNVDLLNGQAHLQKIQITNPSSPLKNLFEIDKISLHFSVKELLKKKLVIHSVNVSGITSGSLRVNSGVIDDMLEESEEHPVLWQKTDTGVFANLRNQVKQGPLKYLSQITTGAYTLTKMPNLKKSLNSLKYLETLNQSFEKTHRDWTSKVSLLPTPTQLNAWQGDVATWSANPREIASTIDNEKRKHLAIQLREKYETISNELASAQKELTHIKNQMDGINQFLAEDIETLKKELNLPTQANDDLSFSLFGIHAISFLEKLSYWSDTFRHHGTVTFSTPQLEIVRTTNSKQIEYHFLNKKTEPSFYIGEVKLISGSDASNGLVGEFKNFTLFPHFYNYVSQASVRGNITGSNWEGIKLEVQLASENELPLEKVSFSVDSFPLEDFVIRSTSDFDIKISSGTAKLGIEAVFKGPRLDVTGIFETMGTKFSVKSQFSPFEELLDSLTRSRTILITKATAQGEKNSLQLTIESDFGKQLAKNIHETFIKQLAQIDDTLKTHVLDSLFPLRQTINEKIQDAENISLAQMRSTLNELESMMIYTKKYDPQAAKFKHRYSQAEKNHQTL